MNKHINFTSKYTYIILVPINRKTFVGFIQFIIRFMYKITIDILSLAFRDLVLFYYLLRI